MRLASRVAFRPASSPENLTTGPWIRESDSIHQVAQQIYRNWPRRSINHRQSRRFDDRSYHHLPSPFPSICQQKVMGGGAAGAANGEAAAAATADAAGPPASALQVIVLVSCLCIFMHSDLSIPDPVVCFCDFRSSPQKPQVRRPLSQLAASTLARSSGRWPSAMTPAAPAGGVVGGGTGRRCLSARGFPSGDPLSSSLCCPDPKGFCLPLDTQTTWSKGRERSTVSQTTTPKPPGSKTTDDSVFCLQFYLRFCVETKQDRALVDTFPLICHAA